MSYVSPFEVEDDLSKMPKDCTSYKWENYYRVEFNKEQAREDNRETSKFAGLVILDLLIIISYFLVRKGLIYLVYGRVKIDFNINDKLWYRIFNVLYIGMALWFTVYLVLGYFNVIIDGL